MARELPDRGNRAKTKSQLIETIIVLSRMNQVDVRYTQKELSYMGIETLKSIYDGLPRNSQANVQENERMIRTSIRRRRRVDRE